MSEYLGYVENTFEIEGRGVVVSLDVAWTDLPSDVRLKTGDKIEFRSAAVTTLSSHVAGIEIINAAPEVRRSIAFLLPKEIRKDQVQLRSEVWTLY